MEVKDIVALAHAGFTAAQIVAIAQSQPMVQPQPQPQNNDPVLAQLKVLTGAVQNGYIMNTAQPPVKSAEDIVAAIINPPTNENK